MGWRIVDLRPGDEQAIYQAAALLVAGFKEHWPHAWPDIASALEEVRESFAPDRISRVAVDDQGAILGWVGGISQYRGKVWELHPLVVRPDCQGQGIGRTLVVDLEEQVRARGGLTIVVGTDDEDGQTSLTGVDLYPNVLEHLVNIKNLRRHPYEFYQKLGFVIIGAVPDANGLAKPDILMAKRVRR
ncbi:MAG: GNAT family N-acetyltransferase [Deinococcus sp.]|nr:GNAT family N-acetyltransferase [Deinococcus sp.]